MKTLKQELSYSMYFDSFGLGVVECEILKYLKYYYKSCILSNTCIQDITGTKCTGGFYIKCKKQLIITNRVQGKPNRSYLILLKFKLCDNLIATKRKLVAVFILLILP